MEEDINVDRTLLLIQRLNVQAQEMKMLVERYKKIQDENVRLRGQLEYNTFIMIGIIFSRGDKDRKIFIKDETMKLIKDLPATVKVYFDNSKKLTIVEYVTLRQDMDEKAIAYAKSMKEEEEVAKIGTIVHNEEQGENDADL